MNNKVLLIVLVALLAVYGLYELVSGNENRTFDPEIVKFEKNQITKLVIHSKADSLRPFTLTRDANNWTINKDNQTYLADSFQVNGLLNNLLSLRATYVAAKNKDKWPEFELTEGEATKIEAFNGGSKVAEVWVGKFSANPQSQQVRSFVRTGSSDNVYAVEGMTAVLLNKSYNDFRDKSALNFDLHQVEELVCEGEMQYSVVKTANGWQLNGSEMLDSSKVQNFLMNLNKMSGSYFADDFEAQASNIQPIHTLTIKGDSLPNDIVVKCWRDTTREKPFVIQTSQYPQNYFASDTLGLFKRIFKPVSEW